MDNSMAAKPRSALKGDPYRAYEELPAEVRLALQEALVDWCPLRAREWHRQLLRDEGLRPRDAASFLVQAIRGQDQAELAAFAAGWGKGAAAYPHLAAEATIQRYAGTAGMPAAEPPRLPRPAGTPKPARAAARPAAKPGKGAGAARPARASKARSVAKPAAKPKSRPGRPQRRRARR